MAGAKVDKTLKHEPGCLVEPVARLSARFVVFSPRPPTKAFTYPVC